MRPSLRRALAGLTALAAVAAAPALPQQVDDLDDVGSNASEQASRSPVAPVLDAAERASASESGGIVGDCDPIDPTRCLLPFPNDAFTVVDGRTATGIRVDLPQEGMPRSLGAKPMDVHEWNRNDGWSPGSPVLAFVEDLDLQGSFGIDHPVLEEPSLSVADDAPIVLLDADTGERHPYWAELDMHAATAPEERTLIIRPLVNFTEGHRYVVAMRDLVTNAGEPVQPSTAFTALRDGDLSQAEQGTKEARYRRIFADLGAADVERGDLQLAWDFTVGSAASIAGRMLSIRNHAFALLGDTDLADGEVQGDAPAFSITSVEQVDSDDTAVRVTGTVDVPNFLTLPQDTARSAGFEYPALPEAGDVYGQMVPGSRFYYGPENLRPSPTDLPQVNPAHPVFPAEFVCNVPRRVVTDGITARPMLYGHGLLGDKAESSGGSGRLMREAGFMNCGVDWAGMATEDIANVATMLADMSNFASLADRVQQGMLNFLYVGRALVHPQGLRTHEAFQREDGSSVFDGELVYDGNSQGAIIGGALTAVAPDFTRATVGVPGMNYSTLLNRSVDWEGVYSEIAYAFYPDKIDQQLLFALIQQLWDRAETNGYAAHATDDPYPNTPPHQVLLHVALGDYQVANVAAEVEARTMGADVLETALLDGRHWADDAGERMFGFDGFVRRGPLPEARSGSALVYFDSGNPIPPSANVPPEHRDEDPHEHPRRDPLGGVQKAHFYTTGEILDVRDGEPWFTPNCPVHPEANPGCEVE